MIDEIKPQLWIVAGPNGAGKSTLVAQHALARQIIINPDDIAKRIGPGHQAETAVKAQAGREALQRRKALLEERQTFGIETTLTGRSEIQLMCQAKEQGYKLNLVYVGLDRVEKSSSRVGIRVLKGGHDVPEEDILRRFGRSLGNLPEAIKVADRAFVLDNSGRQYRLACSIENGHLRFMAKAVPAWAIQALEKAGFEPDGHRLG